jgi:hypothetical protein
MTGEDELAHLEAERDQLLSMIAYHQSPYYQKIAGRRPAGPIMVFGFRFYLTDLIGALFMAPTRPTPGEPEVLQRLADCEARIGKLKAAGS